MMQMVVPLLLINLVVLLAIGLVRQQNPFDVLMLILVMIGNAIAFVGAALLTHGNMMNALGSLAANVLPVMFVAGGVALLMFVMTDRSRSRHRRA